MHWVIGIAAAVLIISGYTFFFTGLSRQLQLQHDLNLKLPASQKFEPLFWTFGRWQEFRKLEAVHLPGSNRLRNIQMLSLSGLLQVLFGILLGVRTLVR